MTPRRCATSAGRIADPALAAERARRQHSALDQATSRYTSVITRQGAISRSAHADFDRQRPRHDDAQASATVHGERGAVLAAAATRNRRVVVQAMIASYTSSGAPQALELLTSRSPSDYLDAATLQQYTVRRPDPGGQAVPQFRRPCEGRAGEGRRRTSDRDPHREGDDRRSGGVDQRGRPGGQSTCRPGCPAPRGDSAIPSCRAPCSGATGAARGERIRSTGPAAAPPRRGACGAG